MGNPLYSQLNSGNNGTMQSFMRFMRENKGKNPDAMIQEIVSSGRLSQGQLDQIQAKAGQMAGMLDGIRGAFGF